MSLKSLNIIHFISIYGGAIILVILILVFNLIAPNFYSFSNYVLILKQITIIGILSCGQCFVIIGKGIDLNSKDIKVAQMVKTPTDAEYHLQYMSGATITSDGLNHFLKRDLDRYKEILKGINQ